VSKAIPPIRRANRVAAIEGLSMLGRVWYSVYEASSPNRLAKLLQCMRARTCAGDFAMQQSVSMFDSSEAAARAAG
jgi:hypothetical protein